MNWEHVITAALTALVAITVIRRLRSHNREHSLHISFHWHTRQQDESKEDNHEPDPDGR